LLVLQLYQEAWMTRSNVQEQGDLFSNTPTPPGLTTLQHHRDELIDLIGRLLWEVVQGPAAVANKEESDEQDKR
jgi:hypothetical protein